MHEFDSKEAWKLVALGTVIFLGAGLAGLGLGYVAALLAEWMYPP